MMTIAVHGQYARWRTIIPALAVLLALGACTGAAVRAPAATGDYMVAVNRPNHLHVIDLDRRAVLRTCDMPGYAAPGTVVMSPDKHIAYVLAGRFSEIYGIDIDTCELTFSASQSQGNVRVVTYGGIAVSPDGGEVYTHQNPTRLYTDHYEVLDTRVAVYRTSDGLDARPVRLLPAPRQIGIMATDAAGTLYLAGANVYAMDVQTGSTRVVIASRDHDDPRYSPRDALTIWPIGTVSNDFIRLYTVARYQEGTRDLDSADWFWGYERIDLLTGAAESREFAPLEDILFSGLISPANRNRLYGVFARLQRYDIDTMTLSASTDELDHTYYLVNLSTDGATVYLSGAANDIAIYDAGTLEKQGRIEISGGDMALSTAVVFRRP